MIRINLALQGGGAHGAFTWGALDRLLQEDDIEIAAISGTSAGALNAAALKAGLCAGGREGARASLSDIWGQVGGVTDARIATWLTAGDAFIPALAQALEFSPGYLMFDAMTRALSPYVYGPMLRNPLERIVENLDFELICSRQGPELYLCATNVRSGKIRVFSGADVQPAAILASACLPTLFQAVEIEDPVTGRAEAYWDGGYTGNPALFPLFGAHLPDDILIVNINPLTRDTLPTDTAAIQNRINEISFNSSLLRELRAIDFVRRLIVGGTVAEGQMKKVLVHMVSDDDLMNSLNVATKTMAVPLIMGRLKAAGETAMDRFLGTHKADLGRSSTVDLAAMFA